jgi:hypothetical protein
MAKKADHSIGALLYLAPQTRKKVEILLADLPLEKQQLAVIHLARFPRDGQLDRMRKEQLARLVSAAANTPVNHYLFQRLVIASSGQSIAPAEKFGQILEKARKKFNKAKEAGDLGLAEKYRSVKAKCIHAQPAISIGDYELALSLLCDVIAILEEPEKNRIDKRRATAEKAIADKAKQFKVEYLSAKGTGRRSATDRRIFRQLSTRFGSPATCKRLKKACGLSKKRR